MIRICDLFDLNHTAAKDYLSRFTYPWEALPGIKDLIRSLAENLGDDYQELFPEVWVHKTAVVAPSASITGPCIIGPETEIRHCAFIRGSALIGAGCVVGNSTEVKNAILFDGCQIPHFNYAGDSILGYRVHMGGGAMTSNVRSDHANVVVHVNGENYVTGMKKVGAMLGDFAEIGADTLTNPGTIVGRNSIVYPSMSVRGFVPEQSILKNTGVIVHREVR